ARDLTEFAEPQMKLHADDESSSWQAARAPARTRPGRDLPPHELRPPPWSCRPAQAPRIAGSTCARLRCGRRGAVSATPPGEPLRELPSGTVFAPDDGCGLRNAARLEAL